MQPAPHRASDVEPPPPHAAADAKAVWAFVAAFSAASVACAVFSDGFLTADALTHYLYARHAFDDPALLVDVWGRPVVTALYAVPASLAGPVGARLTSLVVALGCAAAAMHVARGQGVRRPVLALLFTLAQPLVFLNSFAEMTELPFAMLAGVAFLAYQSRRWWAAAALAGLLPLTRPEGFEFVALAALGLLANKRPLPLLLLPLPLVLWNHVGWELYGREGAWWRWLIDQWPYSRDSTYPRGHLLQFVFFLPAVVGPLVVPATLAGAWRTLRVARRPGAAPALDTHDRACRLMTLGIPLSILVVHSLLYGLGKMASYGEPRYLLVAAPFWAVLSARGWEWLWDAARWTRPLRWAAVAAALPAAVLAYHPVLPLRRPAHWQAAEQFAEAYRRRLAPAGYAKVLAAHPAVYYYLGVSPVDRSRVVEWRTESIRNPPPGAVLLWDPIYSARNANVDRVATVGDVRAAGWVPRPDVTGLLAVPEERSARPTPDPAGQLAPQGDWAVFTSPPDGERHLPRP